MGNKVVANHRASGIGDRVIVITVEGRVLIIKIT